VQHHLVRVSHFTSAQTASNQSALAQSSTMRLHRIQLRIVVLLYIADYHLELDVLRAIDVLAAKRFCVKWQWFWHL
jgi:hypothetical protein